MAERRGCDASLHTRGVGIWDWASATPDDPDLVLACAGDVPTQEAPVAAAILRTELPNLRVRFVNVIDLMRLLDDTEHPHGVMDVIAGCPASAPTLRHCAVAYAVASSRGQLAVTPAIPRELNTGWLLAAVAALAAGFTVGSSVAATLCYRFVKLWLVVLVGRTVMARRHTTGIA